MFEQRVSLDSVFGPGVISHADLTSRDGGCTACSARPVRRIRQAQFAPGSCSLHPRYARPGTTGIAVEHQGCDFLRHGDCEYENKDADTRQNTARFHPDRRLLRSFLCDGPKAYPFC
jgi:hypothetical protein